MSARSGALFCYTLPPPTPPRSHTWSGERGGGVLYSNPPPPPPTVHFPLLPPSTLKDQLMLELFHGLYNNPPTHPPTTHPHVCGSCLTKGENGQQVSGDINVTIPHPIAHNQWEMQTVILQFHLCAVEFSMVECCFTSTETMDLLGTVAQDGHLDFHTALEPRSFPGPLALYNWVRCLDLQGAVTQQDQQHPGLDLQRAEELAGAQAQAQLHRLPHGRGLLGPGEHQQPVSPRRFIHVLLVRLFRYPGYRQKQNKNKKLSHPWKIHTYQPLPNQSNRTQAKI